MDGPVKITKIGAEPKSSPPILEGSSKKSKRKTLRTFPRGILKPVTNPSKQPPIKKGLRRITIRLGIKKRPSLEKMTRKQKRQKLKELRIGEKLPEELQVEVLKAGMEAGLISR